jgi:hypothetical protein
LVEALDLEKEDPAVRDRYGRGSRDPAFGEDAGPHWMDQFLTARRLVEAGVRCVTLSFGSWDRHHSNFERLPTQLAKFDQAITALRSPVVSWQVVECERAKSSVRPIVLARFLRIVLSITKKSLQRCIIGWELT